MRALSWMVVALLCACDEGASGDAAADAGAGVTPDGAVAPPAPAALRLRYPAPVADVLCNGRLLACAPAGEGCALDLDATAQGWPEGVVLCQGVSDAPLFAPMAALVFKAGLPIWTPNLSAAGEVVVDARATGLATAFLSPHLTAMYPETARAILGQAERSPYLEALTAAVSARDEGAAATAVPQVVADVLSQATLSQPLSNAERSLGLEDIDVERISGYVTLASRLGTPVDHICAIYALEVCLPDSERALAEVGAADTFPKAKIGQTHVAAKSFFNLSVLAKAALGELFGDLLSGPDLDTFRLEPGRVHDIQCYSGALGLVDEQDAAQDAVLIAAEPEARRLVTQARVANLVSLALDTLRLFVDFDAFGDDGDIAKAVAICAQNALGPSLDLADGASREAWFTLLKEIQGCAIKQLGIVLAKRGAYAVAAWVFDFAIGGGGGWVGRVSRSGMVVDRVVGMVLTKSPVQRLLLAYEVDFAACAPCADACPAAGAVACADDETLQACRADDEGCLGWIDTACAADTVCADGDCRPCGALDQPCCARDACAAGNRCDGGRCVAGCRDECPANGVSQCADRGAAQTCGEHDGDPCLEWGAPAACPVGELCEVDGCAPPSCEDECAPDDQRCAPVGEAIEVCGNCDDDGCRDWCPGDACADRFVCAGADCLCDEEQPDLPDDAPGLVRPAIDDDGAGYDARNSLWPARDIDVLSAYVRDTPGNTIRPRAAVSGVAPGLVYDVCIAFACDPAVNGGEPTDVDCADGLRTTRDGAPACCLLAQVADAAIEIDVNCTPGGLRDDSGTATAYVEATQGSQCWPPITLALTGGRD